MLEIRFPLESSSTEPYFKQLFPGNLRGTYFIARISTWNPLF
jgi:hypothetical protein